MGGSEAVAEVAVAGAARFPIILSVGLTALAISSCGEIALGIGLLVTCVKVSLRLGRGVITEVIRLGQRAVLGPLTSVPGLHMW